MTLKQIIIPILALAFTSCAQKQTLASSIPALEQPPLCQKFDPYFKLGVAINVDQSSGTDTVGQKVVARHFNTIVAENCMKCEKIHPQEDEYFWEDADKFVQFGLDNNQWIVGHCLVWHSQLAPWFCVDNDGKLVSAEILKSRIHDHIATIVGRYKGKVHAWDVVNEAVEDNGSMRNTLFYQILGDEYIPYAFQCAQEADPDAELYINDFAMNKPGKRDKYVKIVNDLKDKGIRIDGIGMQGHIGMDYPDFDEFEKSIETFSSTGLPVMVTELDMTVLPTITRAASVEQNVAYEKSLNPYPESLPQEVDAAWNERMTEFMKLLIKNSDKITRVNFWGVNDADSWRNDWPVRGRKDYPLIFDREWNIKPFMSDCIANQS